MVKFVRWLLFPFSILYAAIVLLRNWAYDNQLYNSTSFHFPVIIIGNLSVGGTGKSPMTEYVLRLIKPHLNIAVLSRGYGRRTKGFRYVNIDDSAELTGDEPLQIKRKFPDATVIVCENRVRGIEQVQGQVDAVLLDDAYQHRKLRPSFSILLLDYESLQHPILPLPTGNFREMLPACKRADTIVITKCPDTVPAQMKFSIESRFRKYTSVPLFYTKIGYQKLQMKNGLLLDDTQLGDTVALVVTGIAKPQPLVSYLKPKFKEIIHLSFRDHHQFSPDDLDKISQTFQHIDSLQKVMITTEKDLQRLPSSFVDQHPLYFLPIDQVFLFGDAHMFDAIVKRAFSS
ncbi:tetraacyldisaccharide 4'-kinase [Sphingobacterium corticibacterium]|uniref:Tetraacyldisaccharide 4'-kinase n=1 Tax=Sphingobacterium corticibacterium TaxID=2484746 RepID=A0A4V2DC55_9SPHI|nr:tetraacyldisaccharide 4'-kinase [Sphingobacterium corticibacterium]RZF60308.1 tetraacyldisaccharide 4'-kinase [Sphingobacterium corticibacterium]